MGSGSNAGQAGVFSTRPHNATCIDVKFNPVDLLKFIPAATTVGSWC